MENNGQGAMVQAKKVETAAGDVTVKELKERESDILYALVLLFTYGQMALIIWDMLSMVRGFAELAALVGIRDPGRIHSFGEMTTLYLGFTGAYIGRNAWQKYKGNDDAAAVPHYVFLRMQRGYFYMVLWAVLCFVAYMLKGMDVTTRLPYELTITTLGVLGGLLGNKAINGFLDKRAVGQLEQADAATAAADHGTAIMEYVVKNGRITNIQCQQITGLKESRATVVLQKLENEGKLEQVGEGRHTYYRQRGTAA